MNQKTKWFYPLYKSSDKKVYIFLLNLGTHKTTPEIIGTKKEISDFIKLLVVTQKMKKYRIFRDMVLVDVQKKKVLDTPYLVTQGTKLKIPKGIDRSWAVFIQDKRLCTMIDRLVRKKVEYVGTNKEVIEFISRFLLTQLLQDWRGPKMMVVMESLKAKRISLRRLNDHLRLWDFTRVFK